MINHNIYSDYIFDFDGVLFDTNFIKKDAIYYASKNYLNKKKLNYFVEFFLINSGIPREIKVSKFFNKSISKKILENYSKYLSINLSKAKKVPYACKFIKKLFNDGKNIHILSGGNVDEIKLILKKNNMLAYFENILAAPVDKQTNYEKINIKNKAIFFGDSLHDFKIALANSLDFVFIYGYTIQSDWEKHINKKNCLTTEKNFYRL